MRSEEKRQPELGFLMVLGNAVEGMIGGFLVLNRVGRPTEFHCTAPVRPNRAQEILYGNTLVGFVCGEQIAPALVGRTKASLAAVLTNSPEFVTAPHLLNVPLGIVFSHVHSTLVDKGQYVLWNRDRDNIKNEQLALSQDLESKTLSAEIPDKQTVVTNDRELEKQQHLFFFESLATAPLVPGVDYTQWQETIKGKNRIAFPSLFSFNNGEKLGFEDIVSRVEPFLKFIDSVEPFERIRLAVEEAQKSC